MNNIYGLVPRYEKIKVKASDLSGKQIEAEAEGFLARIFQHEIDHLDGVVFIDRIKDDRQAFFKLLPDGELKSLNYDKEISNNRTLWN